MTRASIVQRAEQALVPVTEWVEARGLSFSVAKSQAMMTKGELIRGFTIGFGDERIVTVNSVKYLGLWLDPDRSFKTHIEKILSADNTGFSVAWHHGRGQGNQTLEPHDTIPCVLPVQDLLVGAYMEPCDKNKYCSEETGISTKEGSNRHYVCIPDDVHGCTPGSRRRPTTGP